MNDPSLRRQGDAPLKATRPSKVLLKVLGLALRHPLEMWSTVALSVAGAAASLLVPKLIGRMVDQTHQLLVLGAAHGEEVRRGLLISAGLVVLVITGRGLLAMAASYIGERLTQAVALGLRLRYFAQLQRLPFAFHDETHSGDLITRGMLDLEGMRGFIQVILQNALPLVLLVAIAGGLMVRADPMLAAVSLAFVPVAAWVLARNGGALRRTWFDVQEQTSRLSLVMEENLQGVRVVRAFAAEDFELAKFDRAAAEILKLQFRRITLRFTGLTWMTLFFNLSLGGLLWLGGRKVMAHQMTVGQLAEFVAYLTALQGPIRQISMIFNQAARCSSSGQRVFEILDRQPEIADAPDARPLDPAGWTLRFENVSFRYKPNGPDVLSDIDFEVRPGKTLGLVGAPGSGKSTIAALIPRFYDPSAGQITIGGTDIRRATLESLRGHVGLVQQEAFLFDASIRHNLAYADPWAEDDKIVDAASIAQLHEHIDGLPEGYDTRVGERGVSLSGGQRQRASIARGILPGPGIIIFDDSTAAIDAVTEQRVREGLAAQTRDKATIIIAHRLGSLLHADEILVLDGGRIVERGDHAQLLAQGGFYARLYDLQSSQARLDKPAAPERLVTA
ncbi:MULTISPECIES: ABC transporter ATP-binding protein [Phenylobacterium]|uniref:ATP-binding cassette subfamily B protein n=1 Tax=Phenylobacterium koreense TaxID=266125 RepID=A0ABV2EFQ8_9CAUL